jgi:hypothetical protein
VFSQALRGSLRFKRSISLSDVNFYLGDTPAAAYVKMPDGKSELVMIIDGMVLETVSSLYK